MLDFVQGATAVLWVMPAIGMLYAGDSILLRPLALRFLLPPFLSPFDGLENP